MLKPGITVALLAYKEAENLRVLLPQIKEKIEALNEEYTIEVIDTAKPMDETPDVVKEFGDGFEYHNQEEPGFGGAFRTAIKYADRKMFLILDSDGSHNPIYIPDIYNKFVTEKCDLTIGSRYVKGGVTFDSKLSILMSKVLNGCFRLFLGIKAKDISTDYRLYDTAQLKAVTLENVNYDVLQEVILKLQLNNPSFKIGEVPIRFEKRMFGESKRQLIPFIISYIKTLFKLTKMRIVHSWRKNK